MEEREIARWVTWNGHHVPIYEGEDTQSAVKRYKKEKAEKQADYEKRLQIAKNKVQANKASGEYTPLTSITEDNFLVFQNGELSSIKIDKDTKGFIYFRANDNGVSYRLNKETGEVQAKPYKETIKRMYLV